MYIFNQIYWQTYDILAHYACYPPHVAVFAAFTRMLRLQSNPTSLSPAGNPITSVINVSSSSLRESIPSWLLSLSTFSF